MRKNSLGLENRNWPVAAALLASSAALRGLALGRDELWFDEGYSALLAMEPWAAIVAELKLDASPPLYFFTLRLWTVAFGPSPTSLAALSVLSGVLSVYLCIVLGTRLWGHRAGLFAALLLALSPLHVHYSQEVRPYSFLVALTLASLVALQRLIDAPNWRSIVGYCLTTGAAMLIHNYGLFLPVVLVLTLVAGKVSFRTAITSTLGVLAAYSLWLPAFLTQLGTGATQWVVRFWQETPPWAAIAKSFSAFCIGGRVPEYVPIPSSWLPELTPWLAYALFGFTFARGLSRGAGLAATATAVLLGFPFVLSFVKPVYLVGRHDVIALPLFFLICARGMEPIHGGRLWVALVSVGALSALSLPSYYVRPTLAGAEAQARLLVDYADGEDRILSTGYTRNALEYYVRLFGGEQSFASFPTSFGVHRGWVDESELGDPNFLRQDATRLVAGLDASLRSGQRLWIAHSRLLRDANDLLMATVADVLRQTACPGRAESLGFTCWTARG